MSSISNAASGLSQIFGVNLDGLEFGSPTSSDPGVAGTNYFVPSLADINAFAADGASTIRIPFSWERLQPVLGGPLDATYLGYLEQVVSEAKADGLKVILDCHNFGSYDGNLIGSANGPTNAQFANMWGQIATAFAGDSNVIFGLMNEPQQTSASGWLATVNAAISAIGSAQTAAGKAVGCQEVLISAPNGDGASSFSTSAFAQLVQENLNSSESFYSYGNIAFEVHQYFDPYSAGTDTTTPLTNPLAGTTDLLADTNWGLQTGLKLYLGETAVPRDAESQSVLTNLMESMAANPAVWQGMAYWTASPDYSASYGFNIDPTSVANAPQLTTMENALAAIDAAVWIRSSNESLTANNSVVYSVANVLNESVVGSGDALFLNSGFYGTLTGNDDALYALGDDQVVTFNMTNKGAATVFGSTDAVTVGGADVVATLMGASDAVLLTGLDNIAALNGSETVSTAEIATLTGIGDSVTLGGADNSAKLEGAGTASVFESAAVSGYGDSANLSGAYDCVVLSGVNASEIATLAGANESATLSGSSNQVSLNGAYDSVTLSAATDVGNLEGSNDVATLTGASDSISLTGISNTAYLNGADAAATGEHATVAGDGDCIILNGSSNSASMNGSGTSAVHDTVVANGAGDTINLSGAYNFAELLGGGTAATAESAGVVGADDTLVVSGAYDSALLYGIGNGGMYELAVLTGADESVTAAGNFDWATLQGTDDVVSLVAAHEFASLTGAKDSVTLGGCYNSATLTGSSDTATFTGFENTLTIGGGSDIVSATGANETFQFTAGFGQTTLAGFASYEVGVTHDTFVFAPSEFANFASLLADARSTGGNTTISGNNGDSLTLIGITTSALAGFASDFEFQGVSVAAPATTAPIDAVDASIYLADRSALDKIVGGFQVSDTALEIGSNLNQLGDSAIRAITISNNSAVAVSLAQLTNDASEIGKLANANATPYQLTISDTVANLESGLSTLEADVGHLASISSVGGTLAVGLSTYLADRAALAKLVGGFTILDTAANLTKLTTAEIASFAASGVKSITGTRGTLALSVAQALALENAHVAVSTPSGNPVMLSDTSVNIDALTASEIAGLATIGVTSVDATRGSVQLSVAQVGAVQNIGLSLSAPANGTVTEELADGSSGVLAFGATDALTEVAHFGADGSYDMRLYGVTGTFQGQSYVSFDNAYASSGFRDATTYYGAAGNVLGVESFATNGGYSITVGGVLTEQKTVNADGSYEVVFPDVTGQAYSSYQGDFSARGVRIAQDLNDLNGEGVITVSDDNLRISNSALTETLASGSDTFVYTHHAVEAFSVAGTTDDIFSFRQGFGADTITGLGVTGPEADTLNLAGLFTNFAALQSHMTTSGPNTIISDAAGDTLTISGLNPSVLTAARVGF